MKAMVLSKLVSLSEVTEPLDLVDLPIPEPQPGEILVRVSACGVCHTELDEIEGRTAPPKLPVVLGHEVVGRVEQIGDGVTNLNEGDRVGVGWIHSSTGRPDDQGPPRRQPDPHLPLSAERTPAPTPRDPPAETQRIKAVCVDTLVWLTFTAAQSRRLRTRWS